MATTLHTGESSFITGLIQGTDGSFYGTTVSTVFRLSVGLGPFVVTQRTIGRVGSPVNILGTDLTGTTSVTLNGIPAAFIVVSASEIKTTVPRGATTGFVQVVTPDATLSSNLIFRVKPYRFERLELVAAALTGYVDLFAGLCPVN